MINVFLSLATYKHTWVKTFFSSTRTQGPFIFKRIMDLQEAHHSNYKLVLCAQTSCCRWDSLRRRSRTRWWTRSTMMWWLHICYWTIGTLRYTVSLSHLHLTHILCQLLLVCAVSLHLSDLCCFFPSAGWRWHQAPARKWCKQHKRPLPASQGTMRTHNVFC